MGSRAGVSAKDASSIIIGEKTRIAAQTSIGADGHSSIKIGRNCQ